MRVLTLAAVAVSGLFLVGAAYAGDMDSNAANNDPMVCKTMAPPTGSRLGGRHVCMKASAWDAQHREAKDALTRQQNQGQINAVASSIGG